MQPFRPHIHLWNRNRGDMSTCYVENPCSRVDSGNCREDPKRCQLLNPAQPFCIRACVWLGHRGDTHARTTWGALWNWPGWQSSALPMQAKAGVSCGNRLSWHYLGLPLEDTAGDKLFLLPPNLFPRISITSLSIMDIHSSTWKFINSPLFYRSLKLPSSMGHPLSQWTSVLVPYGTEIS